MLATVTSRWRPPPASWPRCRPDQRAARLKYLDRLSWAQQNQLKRLIEAFEQPLNEEASGN